MDEPALREGLPLKADRWAGYLEWAVDAFRGTCATAKPSTQVGGLACACMCLPLSVWVWVHVCVCARACASLKCQCCASKPVPLLVPQGPCLLLVPPSVLLGLCLCACTSEPVAASRASDQQGLGPSDPLTPSAPPCTHPTQIVTHLCYSDFADIMGAIDRMDGGWGAACCVCGGGDVGCGSSAWSCRACKHMLHYPCNPKPKHKTRWEMPRPLAEVSGQANLRVP